MLVSLILKLEILYLILTILSYFLIEGIKGSIKKVCTFYSVDFLSYRITGFNRYCVISKPV